MDGLPVLHRSPGRSDLALELMHRSSELRAEIERSDEDDPLYLLLRTDFVSAEDDVVEQKFLSPDCAGEFGIFCSQRTPEQQLDACECREVLYDSLASLAPFPRAILTMSYFDGNTIGEIAQNFQLSEELINSILCHSIASLRHGKQAPLLQSYL